MRTVTQTPRIATIIVNYQAGDLITAHLDAMLREQTAFPSSEIIIVDNASPNGDAAMLSTFIKDKALEGDVRLIAAPENGGFAAGNNVALRELLGQEARPDYIFLLNPDAYPLPGMLQTLVTHMERDKKAGVAGARLEGEDQRVQISAFRFFSALGEFVNSTQTDFFFKLFPQTVIAPAQRNETYATDWVCGAAALIRTALFEDIGLFDESYFLYYEETDFMLRAHRANWRVWYVHDAHAVHLVGQSSGVTEGKTKDKVAPPYWFRARSHYFRANHGRLYTFIADAGWLAGNLFLAAKRFATGGDGRAVLANIRQFLRIRVERRRTERAIS